MMETLTIANSIQAKRGDKVKDFDADGNLIEGVLRYYPGMEYEWCVLWNDGIETVVLIPEFLQPIFFNHSTK
jgi:hypothetical protein